MSRAPLTGAIADHLGRLRQVTIQRALHGDLNAHRHGDSVSIKRFFSKRVHQRPASPSFTDLTAERLLAINAADNKAVKKAISGTKAYKPPIAYVNFMAEIVASLFAEHEEIDIDHLMPLLDRSVCEAFRGTARRVAGRMYQRGESIEEFAATIVRMAQTFRRVGI
jgi:hypothetical protein